MINAEQIRAARALLDWSTADLAKQTGLTVNGINKIERGHVQAHRDTLEKLQEVFEGMGIEFLPEDGVKRKSNTITKLEGFNDFKAFMDQIYESAMKSYSRDGTKPICVCNVDNDIFRKYLKDYYPIHLERMKKLKDVKIRILAPDIDKNQPPDVHYLQYKYLKEMRSTVAPFYVFGDKFALIDFGAPNPPRILLVNSPALANSFRDQFEIMWNNATDKSQGSK